MLRFSILFLLVAIVAGVLGLGYVEGTALVAAKITFLIFIVLFLASLLLGSRSPRDVV